ncbi:MAG: sugar phosphate isomerase/epimerase, partial [Spirochaetia bacterium]|nr:sugar phosphate isomerase/epimerase [Spirochaetia bacterium]
FCLDTGHALMAYGKDVMSVYHTVEEHLIAFHLADNGGDRDSHLQPGHGNFPWGNFFKALAKRGFTGNVCVETPPFAIGPNYSTEAWCKMFRELNELVEKSIEN